VVDGQLARLRSRVGELIVAVSVDRHVGPGMVIMAVGTWMKRGGGVNILTEDIMSNFGEMAAYGETRVRFEAITGSSGDATRQTATTGARDSQTLQ
jgi:predicted molibdopterin-dependent oxidoreductase YjgC